MHCFKMSVFRKRTKSDAQTEYTCSIRYLDDSETTQLTFKKDTLGQWLFDRVCEQLNLVEKDYFGLRYVDAENQRHWLDPLKTVHKQLKGLSKMVLCFRVKFYPDDPMKLHEEITRYQLFLQLRRDLHHGRLLCTQDEAIQLAAYIIQSEVGDYDAQDHPVGYVSKFKMLPKQTPKHEEKIMEAHKLMAGEVPADCEAEFLKKASVMETYGVDPHQVKDQKGEPLYLGVTHMGIMTFRGSRRTQLFKWNSIRRIAYEGKMFVINYSLSEDEDASSSKKKPQTVGFRCANNPAAKYLWRCAVEQQLFFTLSTSESAPKIRSGGTFFSRGSKFRFSGRCQNEAYEASENIHRTEPPFARTSSLPNFGKKSHHNDTNKSNTIGNRASESFAGDRRKYNVYLAPGKAKEEVAVDVPNIVENDVVIPIRVDVVEAGPKITVPIAKQEVFEDMQKETTIAVNTAPAAEHKENGQVVQGGPDYLETSIDDSNTYNPDQTKLDSDEEDDDEENKPDLNKQIEELDQQVDKPPTSLAPAPSPSTQPSTAQPVKKADSKSALGTCVKASALSLFVTMLLFSGLFYVVFFSPIEHPIISTTREHLQFLEPIRDFIQEKADQMVSYFKK